MKWLKRNWLPVSVLALLVLIGVTFPSSHVFFPVALFMWVEYAAFLLVMFGGLYSCTLTGDDRLRVRYLMGRVLGLMEIIPLTWYQRLIIAFVMLFAGWKLIGMLYVSSLALGLVIKDELEAFKK